ncbi:glycoside hydrolase family 27 protein [Sphingomonas sp. 8AM]|uniref:glycoside hydrolase family 27 protein n=1 Tax=Sphingomonas sp. 8AM TaxID=2653170 RepID=UPI0012F3AFC7|nr:glycoside hydrolase family 27 protein [Sphingomonas sp. 8AM]VXC29691.1 Alpha-galactosidase [Sphingomonas sp. 8AM]
MRKFWMVFSVMVAGVPVAPALAREAAPAVPVRTGATLHVAFDQRAPRPGVRLLELTRTRAGWQGQLTSDWYGVMPMRNVVRRGNAISFDVRNINTPGVPVRRWTATLTPTKVALTGGIWFSEVRQTGRVVGAARAATLAHHAVALPPLGTIAPDGLAATPPMGWSSWNRFAERIDDRTIRAIADAMVSTGLRDAGYRYVNIDDGWQGKRGADGELRPNAKFPDMKALADYVHARGLKLGLYSSPGLKTCAGYTGSYGHVAQDARTFARWGVDYLKYDLCSGEWQYDSADTVRRAYYEMGTALKATGRAIVYSLCEYGRFDVAAWGRSVGGHLWRTTGDITDDYAKMSEIGFERNPRFGHAGPGGWNDPDMLEIGNGGMSEDEYRTHMTLWAMSAAPLMMGHDVRTTGPAALALLSHRAVIAIDQDAAGVQGKAVRVAGKQEVWAKRLSDGGVALALFNRGDGPVQMTVTPADAALTRFAAVRDLWRDAEVPLSATTFTVPAHATVLLRADGEPR